MRKTSNPRAWTGQTGPPSHLYQVSAVASRLPTNGILKLDYVSSSNRRTVSVIENKKIAALATQFSNASMSDAERLSIVHISAPYHFFLCHQIKHILEKFSMSDERLEAAAVLFTRSVDTDEHLDVMLSPLHERERRIFFRDLAHYASYVFSNPTGNRLLFHYGIF